MRQSEVLKKQDQLLKDIDFLINKSSKKNK